MQEHFHFTADQTKHRRDATSTSA